ncbi:MAG: NADP-dependent 3-hydroxy acid dehydrogenase YdfG [Oceanicoccus sp.]|jgi:NADP-dependent 3-hydroxy acid dehydrogenase YdfG
MREKICVVVGVGAGIGRACCQLYALKGYRVIMMARQQVTLDELAASLPGSNTTIAVDVTDQAAITQAFTNIQKQFGAIDVMIYNAARGSFGSFLELDPKELEQNFAVNTMGLLYCARAVAPAMIKRGTGAIMVTGNTAATRGGAKFAYFAPSKAAARILCQSMAKELGPKHVHVAYLVIDAAVDGPFGRNHCPDESDDFFIQPAAIAEAIWFLDQQPQNSWTFELDLRPHRESW